MNPGDLTHVVSSPPPPARVPDPGALRRWNRHMGRSCLVCARMTAIWGFHIATKCTEHGYIFFRQERIGIQKGSLDPGFQKRKTPYLISGKIHGWGNGHYGGGWGVLRGRAPQDRLPTQTWREEGRRMGGREVGEGREKRRKKEGAREENLRLWWI